MASKAIPLQCVDGTARCASCGYAISCRGVVYHGCVRKRLGLGDAVAAGLAAVGITPERVSRLTGRPCRCKQRQQALNAAGAWIRDKVSGR